MTFPYEETGKRILELRKERKLTREKLAEAADISVQFLADIEKGRKNMTVTTLRKLSAALTVSADYIINGDKNITLDTETELSEIFCTIPHDKQKNALELLKIFSEAVNDDK